MSTGLTTVEDLLKVLEQLPLKTPVYVGGTQGYLHVLEDAISFDDQEELE